MPPRGRSVGPPQVQRVSVNILNPAELREGVLKLVEVYGKHGAMKPKIDSEVEEEYDRHRKFLHATVRATCPFFPISIF